MIKSILAFGDSNTWGLIPGSKEKERYPWDKRWTGILQEKCNNVHVIEEGLCGRTSAFEDALRYGRSALAILPALLESHYPLDAAIIMLGTNDCKSVYKHTPEDIAKGVGKCLDEVLKYLEPHNVLLISPIHLGEDVYREDKDPEFDKESVITSRKLKDVYKKLAKEKGTAHLAASDYVSANSKDDEHLDDKGHRILAEAIYDKLIDMKVI